MSTLGFTRTFALLAALLASSGCAKDKIATKPEALAACQQGCVAKAETLSPTQREGYCRDNCQCIVDARFDAQGKQIASSRAEFENTVALCIQRAKAANGLPP